MRRRLILGGPGTGKTTRLLQLIESFLEAGVHPANIAFVSFTRAAAREARERATTRFGYEESDLPWFRTIHSLCYHELGLRRGDIMQKRDWFAFAEWIGNPLTLRSGMDANDDSVCCTATKGDKMLFLVNYASAKGITIADAWSQVDTGMDIELFEVERFASGLLKYKETFRKIDYPDFLDKYLAGGDRLPVDVAIIDEAQDLSTKQWSVVRKAFSGVNEIVVGADDDQAIFSWSGADVKHVLGLKGYEIEVLPISYRLPAKIFEHAENLVSRIQERYEKEWAPRADGSLGKVSFDVDINDVPLGKLPGSWFLLCRNKFFMPLLEEFCQLRGLNYATASEDSAVREDEAEAIMAWNLLCAQKTVSLDHARVLLRFTGQRRHLKEDRQYTIEEIEPYPGSSRFGWEYVLKIPDDRKAFYGALETRGALFEEPNVYIGTIHSVKGAEADHVLVLPDATRTTMENSSEDDERRVAYVACTRARETLWVTAPNSLWSIPIQ